MLFVSKDENLTKAHVRWLEARLVADVHKAKWAEITNGNARRRLVAHEAERERASPSSRRRELDPLRRPGHREAVRGAQEVKRR